MDGSGEAADTPQNMMPFFCAPLDSEPCAYLHCADEHQTFLSAEYLVFHPNSTNLA
jgi:hypothetical protein